MRLGRRILARPEGQIGLLILTGLSLAAITAPWLFPGDPKAMQAMPMLAPFQDAAYPLGSDHLGRDLLAELVHGARTSLTVGLSAALAALLAGTLIGTFAGFAGGLFDEALMRVVEAFQIVPGFLLALAFVSVLGPSLGAVSVAIALTAWTGPARLVRAEVLRLREADFVASARVIGAHPLEIALRDILPLALPSVLALGAVIVANAILTESALSFLGLGDPNAVTWGGMIAEGRAQIRTAPYLSIIPGLAVVVTVIAIYLTGDALAAGLRKSPHKAGLGAGPMGPRA